MVSTSYFLKYNIMLLKSEILNNFADQNDINLTFSQRQFQLPGNAVNLLMCQNFVLGFALPLMLWQDKEKESMLAQNTIPLSRDAFKQLSLGSKVFLVFPIFLVQYHISRVTNKKMHDAISLIFR